MILFIKSEVVELFEGIGQKIFDSRREISFNLLCVEVQQHMAPSIAWAYPMQKSVQADQEE